MAELKILGEKRVKALISVLDAKEKQDKERLRQTMPSPDDIKRMVDDEFGLTDKRTELDGLIKRAQALQNEINEVTGHDLSIQVRSGYSGQLATSYKERQAALNESLCNEPIKALSREYEAKRTQLWLCETLEQAKAVVGIE